MAATARTKPATLDTVTGSCRINMPKRTVTIALSPQMGITTDTGPLAMAIYKVRMAMAIGIAMRMAYQK